ncbi:MAG: winged helix-turn-helix domain-containing protein [Robiginitomaculum sp.]|nr:winged helix-turn-helix domain-containing protein [Robiginitomaculum sp.]
MMRSSGNHNILRCRQSDLALTLGISRMSISAALKQLVQLDLIETGYGEITVPDFAKLSKWVAKCSNPPS